METRNLGHTGPTVSALGLGCMGLGIADVYSSSVRDENAAVDLIHRSLDLGMTFLDTAIKTFPCLLTTFAFYLGFASAAVARPPNIVIIFTDDQGYGDVGVYGAKGFTTPNIDRLAHEGTRFTHFNVAQAVCSASRASLLTGCYPERVGISGALGPQAGHGLNDSETTLAELLRDHGYATGMAGKWHLGSHPRFLPPRHGFDESFGLPYSNDMWPHHPVRHGVYGPLPLIEDGRIINPSVSPDDQRNLTTWYTERAVDFIERHKERPFFFYLAHSMPHVPLFVSDKFEGKSQQGLYGDVIMELDWSVGEVLRALERHGLEDDTLVIFTSDNGPWLSYGHHAGSAGPLREGKSTAWEGGTRVPCVMRWPGRIPANTVSNDMMMTIDLLPTIAGLVGADLPDQPIDGRDVWPLLSRQRGAVNPHEGYAFWGRRSELHAVTTGDGRWKLVLPHRYETLAGRPGGRDGKPARYAKGAVHTPQLYDLHADVGETTDLADEHPEILRRLLAYADKCRDDLGDSLTGRQGAGRREPGRISNGRRS